MEITVPNVNQALSCALYNLHLRERRDEETSRNGAVWVFKEPVTTTYTWPTRRVLFSPLRDANPFFHLFEAIWIMAGRKDLGFPGQFNKNFFQYSDDGLTHPGAYGYRWRRYFGYDQLEPLIAELIAHPDTRRAVLTMWDGGAEHGDLKRLREGTKDAPCNTHIYFDRRGGFLNMTVCCRSNDLWWGAYGANAVHFSVLQEWVAFAVNAPVGVYRQFSNNLHLYTDVVPPSRLLEFAHDADEHDYYLNRQLKPYPLVKHSAERWLREAEKFCEDPITLSPKAYTEPFFAEVAVPMYKAWYWRKNRNAFNAESWQYWVTEILADDWHAAVVEWTQRREVRKAVTA
jgi:hypothetical protein